MVRCKGPGSECDKIHDPYVDTYLQKDTSTTEIFPVRHFDSPMVPMKKEQSCVPQDQGVCNVFNCPWIEYNEEEANSKKVSDFTSCGN